MLVRLVRRGRSGPGRLTPVSSTAPRSSTPRDPGDRDVPSHRPRPTAPRVRTGSAAAPQRSGRIITCAALLVVIVVSGFAAGQPLIVKQTGVAVVVAVLIDATLVRMLLVPATRTLLGDANWWAPAPLRRLHDRLGVSH